MFETFTHQVDVVLVFDPIRSVKVFDIVCDSVKGHLVAGTPRTSLFRARNYAPIHNFAQIFGESLDSARTNSLFLLRIFVKSTFS